MEKYNQNEDKYIKQVYSKIILLAIFSHLSYIIIFLFLAIPVLVIYNIASVLFYCLMQFIVNRGHYSLAVSVIHIEVTLFSVLSTVYGGWGIGMWFYLVAMICLTYFCPYKKRYVPYLFSIIEMVIFVSLKLYTVFVNSNLVDIADRYIIWLFIYNALAGFTIILFSSFISKLSAVVSQIELQKENQNLNTLASYDQLTGLLNRHALLNKMDDHEIENTIVVLGDVDNFKLINDSWGHGCGDMVLSKLSEIMKEYLNTKADICRWGGEEFVIVFYNTSLSEVKNNINMMYTDILNYNFLYRGSHFNITLTFGISTYTEGISREDLITVADRKMYNGKMRGKNQVVS